ncbi:hypothetical protein ACWENQ_19230 [Nonomuraea sp. NPDC004354]
MNSTSANMSGPWLEQLTGAFEILLGRPLASFDADAVYATFFGGNLINELGFARDAVWVNPAALRGVEPVVWDCPIFDLDEPLLEFDASRSVFEFDKAGLPPEFEADLAAACFAGRLVLGGDLAPLLARYDLAASDLRDTWTVCYPRLARTARSSTRCGSPRRSARAPKASSLSRRRRPRSGRRRWPPSRRPSCSPT